MPKDKKGEERMPTPIQEVDSEGSVDEEFLAELDNKLLQKATELSGTLEMFKPVDKKEALAGYRQAITFAVELAEFKYDLINAIGNAESWRELKVMIDSKMEIIDSKIQFPGSKRPAMGPPQ